MVSSADLSEQVQVMASGVELKPFGRVWGTGGWLDPEYREALDWVAMIRLLGWGVQVSVDRISAGGRWLIIGFSPDAVGEEATAQIAAKLGDEHLLVVARASRAGKPLGRLAGAVVAAGTVTGRMLKWTGPGVRRQWICRKPFSADVLSVSDSSKVWATLDGAPIIVAREEGRGTIATLAFHPSRARDANGAATALLRHMLVCGRREPAAWLDFEDSLVLRMDDPGGAQNIYSESWRYAKLDQHAWQQVGGHLRKRNGKLSIGYVAGWVDDGDTDRGDLEIDGRPVERVPGAVHPSPLVRYQERSGTVHDYQSEFRGIQSLRVAGLAEVELHGFTHIHPDRNAWLKASDRFSAVSWYRELGYATNGADPLEQGLAAFQLWFQARPSTLICPGDQWTNQVLERAIDLQFDLVSSYYLAIRDSNRLLWATHVCAPYLNHPEAAWFDSGLPVVAYFHDRELALEGPGWMDHWIGEWEAVGALRFLTLRELAAALSRQLSFDAVTRTLSISDARADASGPLRLGIYVPRGESCTVVLRSPKGTEPLTVEAHQDGFGRVTLPQSDTQS